MIGADTEDLHRRATTWRESTGVGTISESQCAIGGGSLPGQTLRTFVLLIEPPSGADAFARRLREHKPPVAARIEDGRVILDPRTVAPAEDAAVIDGIQLALD
jgi:L-seryl-tRNA(Ser) seleniumtransferase